MTPFFKEGWHFWNLRRITGHCLIFAVEELPFAGWEAIVITYDLHHDEELVKGNIMTEYEEKFSAIGNPICKYIIHRKKIILKQPLTIAPKKRYDCQWSYNGVWLSLVERYVRDVEAAGSNPVTPTIMKQLLHKL